MLFCEFWKIGRNINRPEFGIWPLLRAGFAVRFAHFYAKLQTAKYFARKWENTKILDTMKTPLRFLALGDSYTIGEGVDSAQSWPVQLKAFLRSKGIPIDDPIILAQTGWTTGDLLTAIEKAVLRVQFDLVTLLIGVNNQYQGGDPGTYRDELRDLLGLAVNLTGGNPAKILGMSIPDWGVTPYNEDGDSFKISAEIDQFNRINQTEFQVAGVEYINITPISRCAADDVSLLAPDNLHPSGKMYTAWVKLMLPVVQRILQLPKG